MEATKRQSSGQVAVVLTMVPVAVALLYILSPIPFVFAANHFGNRNTHAALRRFYGPFGWAYRHTRLRGSIQKYGDFVGRL